MQIKITVGHHLAPVRGLSSKRQDITNVLTGVKKKEALCTFGGIINWNSNYWKTVWRILKKLKIELSYDQVILPLGLYPKVMNIETKRYLCPHVHSSLIYNKHDMEKTCVLW